MDKLVFITGASSGIGQALAWRYHQAGWRLALSARRTDAIERWAAERGLESDRFSVYGANVADADDVISAGRSCIAKQGLPDAVIANAGLSIGMDSAVREDIDLMARTLAINTVGMAATFHPFIARMRERGSGTLVGIASAGGIRGMPGHGAYCASKAAVISYCESLRGELRAGGIRVVTIVPGYVDTPLTRGNRYPMPFLMTPEAFAKRAFDAIEAGASYRVIPWQMGLITKLLRLVPNALFDRALAGRPRKLRQGER
jgi:short-subunit dehydrogenase